MNRIILRTCEAGGGHWSGHNSTSFGGRFFCPKHLWSMMHNFNPQPRGTPGGTDDTVKFIDGSVPGPMQAERYERIWIVLARDGDLLTLRQLGFPESGTITARVGEVYPADPGAVYRYAGKCGKAPKSKDNG